MIHLCRSELTITPAHRMVENPISEQVRRLGRGRPAGGGTVDRALTGELDGRRRGRDERRVARLQEEVMGAGLG